MRKIVFVLFSIFSFLWVHPAYAQNRIPTRVPKPPPPPHVNPYKKKDTAKLNPYNLDTLLQPIPMGRALFHGRIDKEQQQDDLADGKADSIIRFGRDSTFTAILTGSLIKEVNQMQVMVENMPANGREPVMDNQQRLRYLRAIWEMMRQYSSDPHPDPYFYQALVSNMHGMLIAVNEDKLLAFARTNTNMLTIYNGKVLFDNQPEARAYIYTQMGKADPLLMIKRLEEYSSDTFAGNIIKVVSRMKPDIIFNYASSSNRLLRNPIYNTQDELTQAIVKISMHSKSPLKVLPFLSDVYYGRKTIRELDTIAEHPNLYFQNLVRLKLENDSIARRIYTQEFSYRALKYYVREMNELHEAKDEVRFKCIDSLPPSSLYFIMVYGQDEIYTSSFLGTFKRMMERLKPVKGDQLLDSLHYDHFRTFIRMCAGYNTLSEFLGTMEDTAKTMVMTRFIAGLQKGKEDDLEDAVDVADAFGSIRDSALAAFLHQKVKENYEVSYAQRSKKGMIVYSLLAMLFESNKLSGSDTGAVVASSRLRLPPINKVRYSDLVNNDSGVVYQQLFFYGDDDGQQSYESYLTEFKHDKNWSVDTTNKQWTVISSVKGKKVVIYANRPLKEPGDEDAQNALIKFLNDSGIHPAIMIHRGHSYHLPVTLSKLNKEAKIVILGSCGGYHNLAVVLDHSPDAHIISSKQVGATWVNEPIIKALNARLLEGADINWIAMWHELDEYFAKKKDLLEKFDDYVPPYKNLGAIFIKAYRRMMHN